MERDDVVESMARIWRDVLKKDNIGEDESFFACGGDSLSAMELGERIEDTFGVRVRLRQIFDHATIAKLADIVAAQSPPVDGSTTTAFEEKRLSSEFPLALGQQYFWNLATMMPDSAFFVQCTELHCEDIDGDDLIAALQDVVRRQSALHCTFHMRGEHPVQRPDPHREATVVVARYGSDADRGAVIARTTAEGTSRAFNLSQDIPIRATLLCFGTRTSSLLVFTHHIAFDGLSRQVLVQDILAAYRARRGAAAPRALRGTFVEFATEQRLRVTDQIVARTAEFWRTRLVDATPDVLLRGGTSVGRGSYQTRMLHRRVSADAVAIAMRCGQSKDVTLFTVLLTAFFQVVSELSGESRIPVSVQVANRDDVRQRGMIGAFANTLVVVAPDDNSGQLSQFIHDVDRRLVEVYDVQEVPLELAVQALRADTKMNIARMLRLGFSLNERSVPRAEADGGVIVAAPWAPENVERLDPTTFDIVIEVRPEVDYLVGNVHYKPAVYTEQQIDELWRCWETRLLALSSDE